jgi:hypothetical protein
MEYMKTTNGVSEIYSIGNLRRDNPNVSFPKKLTNEILADYGLEAIFPKEAPDYDPLTQYISNTVAKEEDGKWYRTHTATNFPQPTAEENVRAERDRIVAEDIDTINAVRWNAMTKQEQTVWTNYRQALLDVPQQEGFPYSVEWPTKP